VNRPTPILAFIIVLLASCASTKNSFVPGKKYSAQQLHADINLLQEILQENHPSLYWYTPKDSIDFYFDRARASITDSLTESQFRNILSGVISRVRCGHTVVRNSKAYANYQSGKKNPQFPLAIKIWDDSAVVVINSNKKDSVLKRGTIVTAINGRPNAVYIDSMFRMMSTDGYSENFKSQVVSFNFPAYYRNTYGLDSQYLISYIDPQGKEQTTTIKNYKPPVDTGKKEQTPVVDTISKRDKRMAALHAKRRMEIDTSMSTAILSVNTFSNSKLRSFFRKSFREIRQLGLKNVVLDLRQNSGGSVMLSTKLTQYMVDKPFKIADTVAAISRKFQHKKYIRPWFIYWLSMHITARKKADGKVHFRYFEKHAFKPKKQNHFDGDIYLLTGGYTFSAATLVTGALKGQQNVTIVGEETGGGAYGNSAMHLPQIILPNTHLRVTLPLYRLVVNKNLPKNGRGIKPDVEVKPSSNYIKRGVDPKLEKVYDIILEKRKG
jgi:C-terminal processing protease CtpA/Prc